MFPMLPLMAFSMSPPCCRFFFFNVTTLLYKLSMFNVAGGERNPGKFQELLPPGFHKPPSCSQGDMMIPNCTSSNISPLRCSTVARTPCPLPTFNTTAPPCQNRSTRCQTSWEDHYPTKCRIKSVYRSKPKEVQSRPASLQATEVPQALVHQVQECLEVPRTWTLVLLPTR